MRRGTLLLLFFIILLAVGSSYVVFWPNPAATGGKPLYGITNPFVVTEGLDLAGGIRVLLTPQQGKTVTTEQMEETRKVLDSRINGLGLKEPSLRVLSTNGQPSISVEIPHFTGDEQKTVDAMLKTGLLEFWDTGVSGILSNNTQLVASQYADYNPKNADGTPAPQFTGKDVDPSKLSASLSSNGGNTYQINFSMQGDAVSKFADYTKANIGHALTITLDGLVIASANIQSQISGQGQITGSFTQDEATAVVNTLKYGALPVVLEKASESTVSATLGQDAVDRSLLAGAIGIGVVILFMLLYYRLPGLLADIALLLYATITFAIFKLIGVTMTLAGIAGFILSIGMAVDANVLIFERVKEELRDGRILSAAIDIGWRRAWPSIRDSNSSTMITCAVLYIFGSNFGASIIIGFATTLFLGVIISMFTAITVTRTLLNLLVPTGVINHPALFGLPASAVPAANLARRNSVA
jgi:preprotein translocase subunit SecD